MGLAGGDVEDLGPVDLVDLVDEGILPLGAPHDLLCRLETVAMAF